MSMRCVLALLASLVALGCVTPKGDDDRRDGGASGAQDGIASFGPSSGGGAGESERYRLRLIVGAPAPAGRAESSSYRILLGTGLPSEVTVEP